MAEEGADSACAGPRLRCGERSPRALAALGDRRLKATPAELEAALTGRFRDIHALEIGMLLDLIDGMSAKTGQLDEEITRLLAKIPGTAGACTGCGEAGGAHAPGCAEADAPVLSLIARLDEIPGVGPDAAQVIVAELGTDMTQFPAPGHAAAWARLTSRTIQSGATSKDGRTGKGNPCLRGALGQCVMAAPRTGTFLGERYRRIARRRGKKKAIVAVARTITEIACLIINEEVWGSNTRSWW